MSKKECINLKMSMKEYNRACEGTKWKEEAVIELQSQI